MKYNTIFFQTISSYEKLLVKIKYGIGELPNL